MGGAGDGRRTALWVRGTMSAARDATLPALGAVDSGLAVPSTLHVHYVLALLSVILLFLSVPLVPLQLHFSIDMPILNQSMQRLPEVVIIVFLAVHSSDTIHLTSMRLHDQLARAAARLR